MSDFPFTLGDTVIVLVMLVSAFLALARGICRETLTLSAWILSGLFTFITYKLLSGPVSYFLGKGLVVHGVLAACLFGGAIFFFTLVNRKILEKVQNDDGLEAWDQILGFMFGLVRGLLLFAIVVRAYTLIGTSGDVPAWIARAQLYPVIEATANGLNRVLPHSMQKGRLAEQEKSDKTNRSATKEKPDDEAGYSSKDRQAIEQLVKNNLGKQ